MHFVSDRFFSTHTFRTADLDPLQLVLMLYSMIFLIEYITAKTKKHFYWGVVFSALAFLAKGPFSVLPVVVALLVNLIAKRKDWQGEIRKSEYWIGLVLFLLIVIPWHIYMLSIYGQNFFDEYMVKHVLLRGVSKIDGHNNNLLYYFKILFHPTMFFSVELLVISIIRFARSKLQTKLKYYLLVFAFLISIVSRRKVIRD